MRNNSKASVSTAHFEQFLDYLRGGKWSAKFAITGSSAFTFHWSYRRYTSYLPGLLPRGDISSPKASGHDESAHSTMQPRLHASPTHSNGYYPETSSAHSPIPHTLETKREVAVSEASSTRIQTLSVLKTGLCIIRWKKQVF